MAIRLAVMMGIVALGCALAAVEGQAAPVISGNITAEEVTSGPVYDMLLTYDNDPTHRWFKYCIEISWSDFEYALSHANGLLLPLCANPDHIYVFPMAVGAAYDGESTGNGWMPGDPVVYTVLYNGQLMRDGIDPSLPQDHNPAFWPEVKYDPIQGQMDEPGKDGEGLFCFYANVLPYSVFHGAPAPVLVDAVVAKADGVYYTGDLTGDYPSCNLVPEPATMALLGLGLAGLVLRRRK